MNCSSVNSSINYKNQDLNYNISSQFKKQFTDDQEKELNVLENKLNTFKGEKNDLEQKLFYNYLYTMFYMILFIVVFSLLFTSYFNNPSTNNSSGLNSSKLSNKL